MFYPHNDFRRFGILVSAQDVRTWLFLQVTFTLIGGDKCLFNE